jgi:hypothetical protein
MAYVAVDTPVAGTPIGVTEFGAPVAADLADHETRILAAEADITTLQGTGMFLIQEQILTDVAATITFSSIPQTYSDLKLVVVGRTTQAAISSTIKLVINSDTGNNYDWQTLVSANTTATAVGVDDVGSFYNLALPAASAPSGVSGMFSILFPDYIGTTFHKTFISTGHHKTGDTDADMQLRINGGYWRSTSAINRFDISTSVGGDTFLAGSTFRLYGIK